MKNKKHLIKISICLTVMIISIFVMFQSMNISLVDKKQMKYLEDTNISYKVYNKENKIIKAPYNLYDINFVEATFDYHIISDLEYNFTYKYDLETQANTYLKSDIIYKTSLYKKVDPIKDQKLIRVDNENGISIKETIKIDFANYRNLLTSNTNMKVATKFEIGITGKNKNELIDINDFILMIIKTKDNQVLIEDNLDDNHFQLPYTEHAKIMNIIVVFIAISLFVMADIILIFDWIKIIALSKVEKLYRKQIDKIILKDKSNFKIVKKDPIKKGINTIEITNIEDLLELQKENKVIVYESIRRKQTSFIIIDEEKIFEYTIKL